MHTRFPSLEALSKKACIDILSLACQQDGDHIHMLQTTLNQSSMHASTYLESLLLETTLHHGKKLLIQACDNGLAVTVDTLLNALSDEGRLAVLSQEDHYGNTALMLAAQHGHTKIVQLLLKFLKDANANLPAAINHAASSGATALMLAAQNGHVTIVQLLLKSLKDANANLLAAINRAASSGATALMLACEYPTTFQLLFDALPEEDRLAALAHRDHNLGRNTLSWASLCGHTKTVQLLLAGLPKHDRLTALNLTDNYGHTALMWAAQNGHAETVQRLLQHLQDDHVHLILLINKQNNHRESALTNAASNGQTQVVSRLLNALQAANAPMLDAICCGPGSRRDTALTAACSYGHIDIAFLLLGALSESKQALLALMNHEDVNGMTALGHAAASGHLELLKLLLDALPHPAKAAAIKHADRDTLTPLMYAVARIEKDIKFVQVLLDALPDEDRLTAINDTNIQPDKTVLMTVLNSMDNYIDPYSNTLRRAYEYDMMKFLLSYGPIVNLEQREKIARFIAMMGVPYYLTSMPLDELFSLIRTDGVAEIVQNTLEQLISWAIILGHQDFIERVFPELLVIERVFPELLVSCKLSLETHTEFLRLALHAQKFEFALNDAHFIFI